MSDLNSTQTETLPPDKVGRFLYAWSKWSAYGGVVLLVVICILCTVSVLGRWLFNTPIKGDVEIVQIACAMAVAAFLPYAQMKNAHVIVDFFTLKAPKIVRRVLDILANVLLSGVGFFLAWRSLLGMLSTKNSNSTTMILALPEWWAHLTIAPGLFLLGLTAFYTAWQHIRSYGC
ncbi:MAG: TRAP transporter small permease [Alysiella sp.]|uniref:TRAP transporter small permease n=1 Tax=Alysiella sp. TaxID=1872483 RepID=UPI0026DC45BC|nr:TRAP transporter small permease [Alysiella sp.]MDO4433957.1 TRAP transporter small permease [Alysiella sp.]